MKRIILLLVLAVSIFACSDAKEKKTSDTSTSKTDSPANSSDDKSTEDWLAGKEWKATEAAPFKSFKLFADRHMEYSTSVKDGWSYKKGVFGVHMNHSQDPMVTWPLKKVSDTSFTFYVEPSNKTFIYTFVKNL